MSIELESVKRIAALRDKADAVTGETSDTLAGAVDALIAGYGGDSTAEEQLALLISRGGSYSDMKTFVIPKSVTSIGVNICAEWYYLEAVVFHDNITYICKSAFQYTSLVEVDLPASLVDIGRAAFAYGGKLERVTFHGTPTAINTTAFSGQAKLVEINVPWAEGAVANAPWGATNATINYNYTEG